MKQKVERQKGALARLEEQLKLGVKPISRKNIKDATDLDIAEGLIPLTEKDVKRIKEQIAILKDRVK